MEIVVSQRTASFINEHGGRLYVWPQALRCCGGIMLRASTRPSKRIPFARSDTDADFELYMPAQIARPPEELHLELRRFPRRVEAYWNGCAWIV